MTFLCIHHVVEKLKVPLPTPYLAGRTAADFLNGSNFAFGAATALEPAFLETRGLTAFVPVSLSNETTFFEDVLQLLSSSHHGNTNQNHSKNFSPDDLPNFL